MRFIKGFVFTALSFSTASIAASPNDLFLQCTNGIHATLKQDVLNVEGIFNLPFAHIQSDDQDKVVLVFADSKTEAKVMMTYLDAKWFIQNTDGNWVPCSARKTAS